MAYSHAFTPNLPSHNHEASTKTSICKDKALAGVAQRTGHRPANLRVAGWISSWGTSLGCGQSPQLGACEKYVHVSLPLFLPSLLSKIYINTIFF